MSKKMGVAAIVAIALAGGYWAARHAIWADAPEHPALRETDSQLAAETSAAPETKPSFAPPMEPQTVPDEPRVGPDEVDLAAVWGHVVDKDGKAVSDAVVELCRVRNGEPASTPSGYLTADDEGGFRFVSVPVIVRPSATERWEYEIRAWKEGLSGFTRVSPTPARRLIGTTVVVKPGTEIFGYVRSQDKRPVAGAKVEVRAASGEETGVTSNSSDESGMFIFEGLPAASYKLLVAAPTYAPRTVEGVAPGAEPVYVTVTSGATVEGLLTDTEDRPVVEGRILLGSRDLPEVFWGHAVSDAGGRFRITGLTPGNYLAYLEPESAADAGLTLAGAPPSVTVPDTGTVSGVLLKAAKAAGITGTVVNERTGAGLADVQVTASSEDTSPAGVTARTDSKGAFALKGLGEGSYTLNVTHSSRPQISRQVKTSFGQTTDNVELQLNLDRAVRGKVVDVRGRAVSHASVIAVEGTWRNIVLADGDGDFTVYPPPTVGSVLLQAATADAVGFVDGPQKLGAGGLQGIELKLQESAVVQGKVIYSTGRGVPNVPIRCESSSPKAAMLFSSVKSSQRDVLGSTSQTDGAGGFLLALPAPATYTIYTDNPGLPGNERRVSVTPGQTLANLVLHLEKGEGAIAGKVTYGRAPAAGAEVLVGGKSVVVGSQGSFLLEPVEAGEVPLTVRWSSDIGGPGVSLELSQTVTVASGVTSRLDIELMQAGGIVTGAVTKEEQPVSGIGVSVYGGEFTATTTTDPQGIYRVEGVPPGPATIALRLGSAVQTAQITVQQGAETSRDLDVAGGAVSGSVTGVGRSFSVLVGLIAGQIDTPTNNIEDLAALRQSFKREVRLDEDGGFSFDNLEQGSYTILAARLPKGEARGGGADGNVETRVFAVRVEVNTNTRVDIRF